MTTATLRTPTPLGSLNAHISEPTVQASLTYSPTGCFVQLHCPRSAPMACHAFARGTIQEFSRQARKRMLQAFGQIDEEKVSQNSCFITLTYPDEYPTDRVVWHKHIGAFLDWLAYRYPDTGVFWRLEFQERGAPHWHLLVIGARYIPYQDVTDEWASIAHVGDRFHGEYATKVQGLKGWRQACYYVSKYCAKVAGGPDPCPIGRCWGVRHPENIPTSLKIHVLSDHQYRIMYSALLTLLPQKVQNMLISYDAPGFWSMIPGNVVADMLDCFLNDTGVGDPWDYNQDGERIS